jgi:tRNA threonylcarbamoyladenosine biosynthesis protein TsaE
METKSQKISKNLNTTKKIAQNFLIQVLKGKNRKASIVGLYGDLGTGKTTFTQFIAKNFGITRKVNSPTFVILKKYPIKNKKFESMFHIDAYRLKNEKELEKLGWKEVISNPKNIVFIEWPERVLKTIPKKHHKILISHTKEGNRNFEVKYHRV